MQTTFDKSEAFVTSQFRDKTGFGPARRSGVVGPAITISHQTGAGAYQVAEHLKELLETGEIEGVPKWTVLDRQLVEQALEEHHLPPALANKIPEDKRSYVADVLDDLFGLRPPSWVLVPQIVETTVRLAERGHVILIGRGAAIVTAQVPNVFHVRLVASLPTRIKRIKTWHNPASADAARLIDREDRGRRRYIRANFHARPDDDLLYHMVLNTDRFSFSDTASLIAEGAQKYFQGSAVFQPFVPY